MSEKLTIIPTQLQFAKAGRVVRRYWPCVWKEFWAPFWNGPQLLSFLTALLAAIIIFQTGTIPQRTESVDSALVYAQAFSWAVLFWGALMLFRAPFVIISEDRSIAAWDGHHRSYKAPILVASERFEAGDGGVQMRQIRFDDADPRAVVYWTFELTPQVHRRANVWVAAGPPDENFQLNMRQGPIHHNGFSLPKDQSATLYVQMEPETVPVVCRVFCQSYFLGGRAEEFRPLK